MIDEIKIDKKTILEAVHNIVKCTKAADLVFILNNK